MMSGLTAERFAFFGGEPRHTTHKAFRRLAFTMARSKYFTFSEIQAKDGRPGLEGKSASQMMELYRAAASMNEPVILECGTRRVHRLQGRWAGLEGAGNVGPQPVLEGELGPGTPTTQEIKRHWERRAEEAQEQTGETPLGEMDLGDFLRLPE